jgi:O-antigen/teichoic acid export membrane protein
LLKQKTFLSFAFNILSSFFGFVSVFFVARFMGPQALGAISAALAFTGLFAIFGDFGFGIAHYKRVSEGQDLGKCIGTFLVIRLATTGIMTFNTLAVLFFMKISSGKTPLPADLMPIFYIVLVSVIIGNMLYVITYTFTARVEKAKEWGILLTQKFFVSLFRVVVAVTGLAVIYLAWSNLLGVAASVLVALYFFRRFPIGRPDKVIFRSYLAYAIPSLLIGVTETVSMNIDKVFISYFWDVAHVGYYSSAQSLIAMLSYVGVIFIGVLLPTYSSLHAENKMSEIRELANRVERYISLLLMPLVFFILFFADAIRRLVLGPKFVQATPIMAILVVNAMLVIFTQPYSSQLLGTNQVKLGMAIGLAMLGVNIAANLLLIPRHVLGVALFGLGARGAAYAILISSSVGTVLFRYFAFRTSGARPNYRILYHLAAALLSFGSSSLLLNLMANWKNVISLAACFAFGGALYVSLLVLIRELTMADVRYYLNMINPKLLMNYMTTELKS